MKKWYLNLSIKYKLLIMFYFFLALLSMSFYYYNNRIAAANLMENVGNANLYLLEQINSNVLFLRREIEDMTTQLMVQPQVQAYIQPYDSATSETQKMYIDSSLKNAVNLITSKDYVSSLSVCGFQNNSVPFIRTIDSRFSLPDYEELSHTEFFQAAKAAKGKPVWLENSDETYLFAANNKYNRIFMIRMIREYNTYENMGLIVVGISEPALRREYTRGINMNEGGIAIFSKAGSLISGTGNANLSQLPQDKLLQYQTEKNGVEIYESSKNTLLLSHITDEKTGWTYLYGVPTALLTKSIDNSANYLIPFCFTALLLSLPLVLFASLLIIRPIRKLLAAMHSFENGNFDSSISFHYRDEIGQLGNGYNEMVKSLAELIDRVYVLQIREQEAELNALQSQINPHFLYNTLDSIYGKTLAKGETEIAEMVWTLSNLFRTSLNKGNRYVTVDHEFQFLEQYLRLQQLRYGSKITYQIDLAENAKTLFIPKLILQPIVENAIYHGLEPKGEQGSVTVSCFLQADKLHFRMSDNGVGMETQVLTALRDGTNQSTTTGGYALHNVRERLRIIYQNNFTMTITSNKGLGTTVTLILPALQEGEYA